LKKELLDDVIQWIEEDRQQAKEAFEESALDVVQHLRRIDATLFG
jgi:hypothetical protein